MGPELSEQLDIPCVCNVRQIKEVQDKTICVEMEMSEDMEALQVAFPCLLTVQKDIYEPRLPSYKKAKETRERTVEMYTLTDMADTDEHHYGLDGSPTQVQRIFPPEVHKAQETWQGTGQELADRLHQLLKQQKFIV